VPSSKTKKIVADEIVRQTKKAGHRTMHMAKAAYDKTEVPKRDFDKMKEAEAKRLKAKAKARKGKKPMDYMKPQTAAEQKIVDDYNAKIEAIRKSSYK
jgi:hypothetical protein